MSRGLGRRERHILEVCRAWAETEPHPSWRWVPMDALVEAWPPSRSEREALRRAASRLAEQGLVERGATGYKTWLLKRHEGDAWHHGPQGEPPAVHGFGGHAGHQLVVRLPLSPADQVVDDATRAKQEARASAYIARAGLSVAPNANRIESNA